MKKVSLVVLSIIFFLPFNSTNASPLKNVLKFGSGFVCGFLGHEVGHLITCCGNPKFDHFDFKSREIILKNETTKTFALAGFGEQILSTEIILATKCYKNSPFWKGYLTYNIIQPVAATITIYKPHNDFNEYSLAGGDATTIKFIVNFYSILTLCRILN